LTKYILPKGKLRRSEWSS